MKNNSMMFALPAVLLAVIAAHFVMMSNCVRGEFGWYYCWCAIVFLAAELVAGAVRMSQCWRAAFPVCRCLARTGRRFGRLPGPTSIHSSSATSYVP